MSVLHVASCYMFHYWWTQNLFNVYNVVLDQLVINEGDGDEGFSYFCFDQLIGLDEVRQKAPLGANEEAVLLVWQVFNFMLSC